MISKVVLTPDLSRGWDGSWDCCLIWWLGWGWRICSKWLTHMAVGKMMQGVSVPPPDRPPPRAAWASSQPGGWLPSEQMSWERERDREERGGCDILYDLGLAITSSISAYPTGSTLQWGRVPHKGKKTRWWGYWGPSWTATCGSCSHHLSVQFSSVTQSCPTLCNPMDHSTPGFPVHHQLPEFTQLMSTESVMPFNHLILCQEGPLSWGRRRVLRPSIFPSIRVFSDESVLRIRWPKYWSFSFKICRSTEHSELISFRMDWLDLLEVQGTLKSLLQHHSSKASILRCSAFFTVQLSHPYMTTGKIIALTRRTFVGKVTSLLFNMLSRLVITFLPRSKRLLISSSLTSDNTEAWRA